MVLFSIGAAVCFLEWLMYSFVVVDVLMQWWYVVVHCCCNFGSRSSLSVVYVVCWLLCAFMFVSYVIRFRACVWSMPKLLYTLCGLWLGHGVFQVPFRLG